MVVRGITERFCPFLARKAESARPRWRFIWRCFWCALGKKVLLIDNHAQLGHVVLYLGMDGSNHHFYDLVQNVSRLDEDLLHGFIATHSSGWMFCPLLTFMGVLWKTDKDSVERTLEFLGTQYDFVLLDCEASFEDINLAVISFSHLIYLVASPEIGAIRDLSRYVDGLVQNEQATKKLQVVINRYSSHEAVTIEQIEKAVHLPIAVKISNVIASWSGLSISASR